MRWQSEVFSIARCKSRSIKSVVSDTNGQMCLITRFITPLKPPESLVDKRMGETLLTVLHRFVSLIPMVYDSVLQRQNKIWGTCAETIDMASGDYVEHAILLTNYFLNVNVDAYVVVGTGTQQSEICYVLTIGKDVNGDTLLRLWNPTNGCTFINHDTGCDLLEVGMVFNDKNMWANIQEKSESWNVDFNLNDIRLWKPFFIATSTVSHHESNRTSHNPEAMTTYQRLCNKICTIQKQPQYKELPKEFYDDLEGQVERDAMDAILESRLPLYTHQNTRCRRILKSLGRDLEKAYLSINNADQMSPQSQFGALLSTTGTSVSEDERSKRMTLLANHHLQSLLPVSRTANIAAFQLCSRFADGDDIRKIVLNSGIHLDTTDTSEFVVSAHVETYGVAYVCAIWIYLAVIYR